MFKKLQRHATLNKIEWEIRDLSLSIVNGLRRTIPNVENVAFAFDPYNEAHKEVNIITNTCPLHNEIISHRLSLIPLCFSANDIRNFDSEKYKFVLKKKNTTTDLMNVTTDDFDIVDPDGNSYPPKFVQSIFPHDPITKEPVIIAKLKPNLFDPSNGDELHLEAYATLGTAAENAAWSPVSQCVFYNMVDDEAANEAFEEQCKALGRALSMDEKKTLKVRFDSLERFRYYKKNEYDEPRAFCFAVESECRLSPEYLVCKALRTMMGKVNAYIQAVENDEDSVVRLQPIGNVPGFYEMMVAGDTHTYSNMIQSHFYDEHIRNGSGKDLEYVGYYCPHPLEKNAILKWKFTPQFDVARINEFLVEGLKGLHEKLGAICHEWIRFSGLDKSGIDEIMEMLGMAPAHHGTSSDSHDDDVAEKDDESQEDAPVVEEEEAIKEEDEAIKEEAAAVEEEDEAIKEEKPVVKKTKKSKKTKSQEDSEVEEEKPKKSKKKVESEAEEEKPKKSKKKSQEDSEVEEEKPKKSKKKSQEDSEVEEEKPKKSKKKAEKVESEAEEEKPKKSKKKVESEAEVEEKPKKSKKKVESEAEVEEKPKKSKKKVESEAKEEKPKKSKKKVESEAKEEKPKKSKKKEV